ncbi:hypothetical protein C2E23DRAFT_735626, partial [Lenzites betulinus]
MLYSVKSAGNDSHESMPFVCHFVLRNEKTGTAARIKGLVDDGAMVNVLDAALWPKIRERVGDATKSARTLRMANGVLVQSQGQWTGEFDFEGVSVQSAFEIFPSGGAWSFLIGKPLLEALRAKHDYDEDIISVSGKGRTALLKN